MGLGRKALGLKPLQAQWCALEVHMCSDFMFDACDLAEWELSVEIQLTKLALPSLFK